jgi:hypothetical protein
MLQRPLHFLRFTNGQRILGVPSSFQRSVGQDLRRNGAELRSDWNSETSRHWIAGLLGVLAIGFAWNDEGCVFWSFVGFVKL